MATTAIVTGPPDGRDLYMGKHATSLGQDLPARQEGFISQNALYDRRNAEAQSRDGAHLMALHKVHDPADLDVGPNEPVFIRKHHPNPYADPRMKILSSVNGMLADGADENIRAANIEDEIVPVGIATDRIQYQTDGVFQLPRAPIAVQVSGKTTLRSQVDIPVGDMVRLKVPTMKDVRERTSSARVNGRPASKVTLEIEPMQTGDSFAERVAKKIIERNKPAAPGLREMMPPSQTPQDRAYKAIEDAILSSLLVNAYTLERTQLAETISNWLDPKDNDEENIRSRKTNLRRIMDPASTVENGMPEYIQKTINAQLRAFAAFSDLLRMEGNFVLGKCTRYNKGVVDVLM